MVVDRAQLWLFFLVTTIGTVGILMDAPHIFEFVDQDRIIDIYRGKWKSAVSPKKVAKVKEAAARSCQLREFRKKFLIRRMVTMKFLG